MWVVVEQLLCFDMENEEEVRRRKKETELWVAAMFF